MQSLNPKKVESIVKAVTQWAVDRTDIVALALVGSWARQAARADSDIDLMFLVDRPLLFREDSKWVDEIGWAIIGAQVERWRDEDYGAVWSRHVYLDNGMAIEFSFGSLSWASIEPIEPGTFRVVNDGCRILYDPKNLLGKLVDEIKQVQDN